MKKILKKSLEEGLKHYPYAGTFAGELFGMTPDDYRFNGWKAAVPYTMETTLQHVKNTLKANMKKMQRWRGLWCCLWCRIPQGRKRRYSSYKRFNKGS